MVGSLVYPQIILLIQRTQNSRILELREHLGCLVDRIGNDIDGSSLIVQMHILRSDRSVHPVTFRNRVLLNSVIAGVGDVLGVVLIAQMAAELDLQGCSCQRYQIPSHA